MKPLIDKNLVIIACAGGGKTTKLVKDATEIDVTKRILFTTYTLENVEQIESVFYDEKGFVPSNIKIQSWFSFLLQDGVRPYQNMLSNSPRVNSICFQTGGNNKFHPKDSYFTSSNDIYSNKLSEFVYECNKKSEGKVLKRLEEMYDYIFIDEVQDFVGYDLDLLEGLFKSNINIVCVGDHRQATLSTNKSSKNSKYKGIKIIDWFNEKQSKNLIKIEEITETKRYNINIARFADSLFPNFPNTTSSIQVDLHAGIFVIQSTEVNEYFEKYKPKVLRYSRKAKTMNLEAINIRLSKGRTYDRVLIFPTGPMKKFLFSRDLSEAGDLSTFYVAVTRARHSVCFVLENSEEIMKFNSKPNHLDCQI